jgi:ABC-type transport system substrate-binding protein
MLRNNIDMLYEVGPDALDSLKGSSTISTFSYTRHYQHLMVMNTKSPVFRSREIRRALNLAIDRQTAVNNALNGYGVASSGPVSLRHWALAGQSPSFAYDPRGASEMLAHAHPGAPLRFTALVQPNSLDERVALELKRQLAALGVEMNVEEASRDELVQRGGTGNYDAAVIEMVQGPTIIRDYIVWRSGMETNWGHWGNAAVDAALDRTRAAANEDDYRRAIVELQQTFIDDPPAVFVAWSVRARAVSTRFIVPAEPDRDIIGTLHLWRPAGHNQSPDRRN